MARARTPEELRAEIRRLRAENRRLKLEARLLQARLKELASRVDLLSGRQHEVAELADRTEALMRWLRARIDALERELGSS